ncbi:cinnamoyl-CoA reductase-like SNL6 [Papaver somniferum]|uniref:cinnamoyl-CoA reductase-like SNL6 n=1 Tax=Papaver somniferum TaxID=3469 RepID=UPI000E701BDA|nr:cinnamoyl-CoA reductase-like SNL6 [Papaver somniferum]
MGIMGTSEILKADLEEFRRLLLQGCTTTTTYYSSKNNPACQEFGKLPNREIRDMRRDEILDDHEIDEKLVCVTSGISFLGLAIVNRLLDYGYTVRILIENQDDLEKLREMEEFDEIRNNDSNSNASGSRSSNSDSFGRVRNWGVVMAKLNEVESLCDAFQGCCGVFHTSAFADPAGISGYSKSMADLEVKASQNVMEACSKTASVRKCVFTSSLLACVWRDNNLNDLPQLLDHSCWSDESVCREKKLWLALGKTFAEKAAWKKAEHGDVKLATICPGFITGPELCRRNPTSSIAYLKGAQEMYAVGTLASSDVSKVAEAHVRVYEAMGKTGGCGRYICFDHVIDSEEQVVKLTTQMGIPANRITSNARLMCPDFGYLIGSFLD